MLEGTGFAENDLQIISHCHISSDRRLEISFSPIFKHQKSTGLMRELKMISFKEELINSFLIGGTG